MSEQKTQKARVLVAARINGKDLQPNDVVSVDAETLKANVDVLDANPAAVRAAEATRRATASDEEG